MLTRIPRICSFCWPKRFKKKGWSRVPNRKKNENVSQHKSNKIKGGRNSKRLRNIPSLINIMMTAMYRGGRCRLDVRILQLQRPNLPPILLLLFQARRGRRRESGPGSSLSSVPMLRSLARRGTHRWQWGTRRPWGTAVPLPAKEAKVRSEAHQQGPNQIGTRGRGGVWAPACAEGGGGGSCHCAPKRQENPRGCSCQRQTLQNTRHHAEIISCHPPNCCQFGAGS